jgi:hypothetical protein
MSHAARYAGYAAQAPPRRPPRRKVVISHIHAAMNVQQTYAASAEAMPQCRRQAAVRRLHVAQYRLRAKAAQQRRPPRQ